MLEEPQEVPTGWPSRAGPLSGRPHWAFCKKVGSLTQPCQTWKVSYLWGAQYRGDTSVWEVPSLTQTKEMSKRRDLAEGDLGPMPSHDPDLKYFLGGCMPLQGTEERRTPSKIYDPNLPLKTNASGLSGVVSGWTCQPGGRSCRQSSTWKTTRNLPRKWGPPLRYLWWGAKPEEGKMATLPCQPLNALGKIGSCHPWTHK